MLNPRENEDQKLKQFGYIISAVLLILSNIGLVNEWAFTPVIFIFTMYFLTGSLWAPKLIRVFYSGFKKYIFNKKSNQQKSDDDLFSKN